MARSKRNPAGLDTVRWMPPAGYRLAVEAMPIAELRRRGSPVHFSRPQRVDFYMLFGVERGAARHTIDFELLAPRAGDWMFLRPGQMQRFDFSRPWDGWVLVFRPDFLPPAERRQARPLLNVVAELDDLPKIVHPDAADHAACAALAAQIRADAARAPHEAVGDLVLYQLCALLTRLRLGRPPLAAGAVPGGRPQDAPRLARLQRLIDQHFRVQRSSQWYADRLGCTARTLNRALAAAGPGASLKTLLDRRVMLEARRLLCYTGDAVQDIAAGLGFDEASNFGKFFKRHAGCTPQAFRAAQTGAHS